MQRKYLRHGNVVRSWKVELSAILFIALLVACEQQPLEQSAPETKYASPTGTAGPVHTASPTVPPGEKTSKKDGWDILTCVGTLLAAVFAAVSARLSHKALRQTNLIQEALRDESKRERMAGLWDHLEKLNYLTTTQLANLDTDEVAKIVRTNVNTMGRLGYLWQVGLIDQEAAKVELAPFYADLFEQIQSLPRFSSLNRTGAELLTENGYAEKLYQEMKS